MHAVRVTRDDPLGAQVGNKAVKPVALPHVGEALWLLGLGEGGGAQGEAEGQGQPGAPAQQRSDVVMHGSCPRFLSKLKLL